MKKISLTITERLILLNQYRIMEKVDRAEAKEWRKAQRIVADGLEGEYDSLATSIEERGLTEDECREVWDIMDMYRAMRRVDKNLVFPGFDGNNETAQWSYAEFLVEDGRWDDLRGKRGLNSHMQKLPTYRRMLKEWKASEDRLDLTKADVARILGKPAPEPAVKKLAAKTMVQ